MLTERSPEFDLEHHCEIPATSPCSQSLTSIYSTALGQLMATSHTPLSSLLGKHANPPCLVSTYPSLRISVPKQAFIDATEASNPILSYGANGIVGLGFSKLSGVYGALTKAGESDGQALLQNMFADNPKEPNFIAFSLQRTTEDTGDVEGSFTIGAQ